MPWGEGSGPAHTLCVVGHRSTLYPFPGAPLVLMKTGMWSSRSPAMQFRILVISVHVCLHNSDLCIRNKKFTASLYVTDSTKGCHTDSACHSLLFGLSSLGTDTCSIRQTPRWVFFMLTHFRAEFFLFPHAHCISYYHLIVSPVNICSLLNMSPNICFLYNPILLIDANLWFL